MTSPPGADEPLLGDLSHHERAVLAAWVDDGDGPDPDGFEDRVVAAYLAERLGEGKVDEDEYAAVAAVARPRAATSEGRVVRLVGWAAAIAAAAAVMLMVRVLPRAEGELVADARHETAAALEPEPRVEPEPEPEPETTVVETSSVLGAEAGSVLAQHCSPCHDSSDPKAKPAALDVFDLEEPGWWLTMSDAQLEEARTRVQALGAASDQDRRTMDAFVEARLRPAAHAG